MSLEFTFSNHSAENVFDLFCDPDFLVERSMAIGELSADAEVAEDEDGVIYVTMRREVTRELPSVLSKLFNSKQVLDVEEKWYQDGDDFVGHSDYDVQGQPVKVSADMRISPNGSGCLYTVNFKVKADIPLVRGKVEKFIKSNCIDGAEQELKFTATKLG